MMESREKRRTSKPRLPRTAKKLDTSRMTKEMGQLGVDVDIEGEVRQIGIRSLLFSHRRTKK